VFPGWFATGVADPQGMKPFVAIASEAKQSQRDGADPGHKYCFVACGSSQ
jgi:hypothetical protein